MKTHQLSAERIEQVLKECLTGSIATINDDGTPYIAPIHYAVVDGNVCFHGLPAGQKVNNIKANPSVSFNVYRMDCLLLDESEKPCDTNTKYESVTVQGTANIVTELEEKRKILDAIVRKYTPQLSEKPLPENMVKGTMVVKIKAKETTGKYWE